MSDPTATPFIEAIASELRRSVRLDPQFDDRVMAAIETPEVITLHPRVLRPWILRPRTISVSPIGAFAAAAALVGIIALGVWRLEGGAPASAVANTSASGAPLVNVANRSGNDESVRFVHQFLIVAPSAKKVALVGDFNDWNGAQTLMTRVNDQGMWSVSLPLSIGLHQFQYVVDDTLRLNDPTLPKTEEEFGSANSVISISARPE